MQANCRPMNRFDILWKGFFEDFGIDTIRFWYPNADDIFDFSRGIEFLDKEMQQLFPEYYDLQAPRFVDMLMKLYTHQGEEKWILMHVEVQGQKDDNFAERMFIYFYRILDRYNKKVVSIAVLTDGNKNFRPNEYRYEFLDTVNIFRFKCYKVLDHSEDGFAKSDNPFAIAALTVLIALKRKNDNELQLLDLSLELVRNLYRKKLSRPRIQHLLFFLKMYLNFEKPTAISTFDNEIKILDNNKGDTMGIQERVKQFIKEEGILIGEEKGIEKGFDLAKHSFVKSLLLETDFDFNKIANLAGTSVLFVEQIKKELEIAK